jgi:hypothetical protein
MDALHLAVVMDMSPTIITSDRLLAASADKLDIPFLLVS